MNAPGSALPSLSAPTVRVHASFLTAMAEFQTEGSGRPDDSVLGQQIRRHGERWGTSDGFADCIASLRTEALPDTPRPEGIVPSTDLRWTHGNVYLGRVSIRHALIDRLRDSERRPRRLRRRPLSLRPRHATAMLAAALEVAADLGITRALPTCVPGKGPPGGSSNATAALARDVWFVLHGRCRISE